MHCNTEIVSTHRHDFRGHVCKNKRPQLYDHDKKMYVEGEANAPLFYVDGGNEYLRRVGSPDDYVDTSITVEYGGKLV
jgi:hypothetical protein